MSCPEREKRLRRDIEALARKVEGLAAEPYVTPGFLARLVRVKVDKLLEDDHRNRGRGMGLVDKEGAAT